MNEPSEPKLCPYRKIRVIRVAMVTPNIFYDSDEFCFCLQDKCAMWRKVTIGLDPNDPEEMARIYDCYCGLAGKP